MSDAVKETKAQRVERLKRELNPWEALCRDPALRARGLGRRPAGVARDLLPLVGHLHAGRRGRRGRGQGRRGQGRPALHGAHPHPERRARLAPAPDDRRPRRAARRAGIADITVRAELPAPLGHARGPARRLPGALAPGRDHHGLLRRRHAQRHRLPGRRSGRRRAASTPRRWSGEATRMLNGNPAFYNLPRKFKVSITGCRAWCTYPEINDIGLTAVRHPATRRDRVHGPRRRRALDRSASRGAARRVRAAGARCLPVLRAIAEIFRDSDVLRQNRERARLKFLFLQHGWTAERFQAAIEERLGCSARAGRARRAAGRRVSRSRRHPPAEGSRATATSGSRSSAAASRPTRCGPPPTSPTATARAPSARPACRTS